MAFRSIISGALSLLPILGAAAQPAPDCARAANPVDRAICSDPKLTAADKAMTDVYAGLRAALPADQRAALLASQRDWLRQRNDSCGPKSDSELSQCILADTEVRRQFLAGDVQNARPGAPRLVPNFVRQERKGRYRIAIDYPQMAGPVNSASAAFNKAMRDAAVPKVVAEFRILEPGLSGESNWYETGYTVTYLDRRLASIVFGNSSYGGGAHPNTATIDVLFDLEKGRPVELADILADPKSAVPAIAGECKARLAAEAKSEDWEFFDDADKNFASVVGNTKSWSADKDGVTVQFDPYSVAAYVVGPRECRLSYAELGQWLKPGGPLPPHQEEKK